MSVELRLVDKIEPMPEVEREVYSPVTLRRLRADIEKNGIYNPIHAVEKKGSRDKYEAFIGLHRLKIVKSLQQYRSVPVVIEHISRNEAIAKGLRENDLREPLNAMDWCKAINLLKEKGMTYSQIAEEFGKDESTVKRMALLRTLPESVKNRIKEGRIPWSNAFYLLRIPDDVKKEEACEVIIKENLTQKEILRNIASGNWGEEDRRTNGSVTRCFGCGELTNYKDSRSKQFCLDCLKKASTEDGLLINRSERQFINRPRVRASLDRPFPQKV